MTLRPRKKRPVVLGAGLLVTGVTLAGCSGAHAATAKSYTSAQAVVTALGRGGFPCTGGHYNSPVVEGATSETQCYLNGNSADGQLIDVFPASHNLAASEVSANSVSTGYQQIFTVYGPNWWVQTSSAYDHRVQNILGGKILAGPWHPSASTAPPDPSSSPSPAQADPAVAVCHDFAGIESALTSDLNTVAANPSAAATGPNSITPLGNTLTEYGDDMAHWSYEVNQAVDNGTTSASVGMANDLGDAGTATVQTLSATVDPSAASTALAAVQAVESDCSSLSG